MPKIPSLGKALEILTECVRERGDSHVSKCIYVSHNEPVCIAGLAFHKLGIPTEVLIKYEGSSASQLAINYWGLPEFNVALERGAQFQKKYPGLSMINWAQYFQDTGDTWGVAVAKAVSEVGSTWQSHG